jgi:hypothetical protein
MPNGIFDWQAREFEGETLFEREIWNIHDFAVSHLN